MTPDGNSYSAVVLHLVILVGIFSPSAPQLSRYAVGRTSAPEDRALFQAPSLHDHLLG